MLESTLSSPDTWVTILTLHHNIINISDGFISSLGCEDKERVGHLYRGRDCENNMVEERFERMCYCRYHRCNHESYYYSSASTHQALLSAVLMSVIIMRFV